MHEPMDDLNYLFEWSGGVDEVDIDDDLIVED